MNEMPTLPRRIPRAARVGESASFSRTFTEADTALFIGVTWDVNPYHTDGRYAAASRFKERIVPGLLTASLLTHLGGLWAFLATEMKFEFLAPVYIGDTITARATVIEADEHRNRVLLGCRCTNDDGQEVLRATISGYPGKHEE